MNTYLLSGNYIGADGNKGLLTEGGTSRLAVVKNLISSLGGKTIALYYAFGDVDIYGIAEMPDSSSAIALSLAARTSGLVDVKVTVLIRPEEVDAAKTKMPNYRAPGK